MTTNRTSQSDELARLTFEGLSCQLRLACLQRAGASAPNGSHLQGQLQRRTRQQDVARRAAVHQNGPALLQQSRVLDCPSCSAQGMLVSGECCVGGSLTQHVLEVMVDGGADHLRHGCGMVRDVSTGSKGQEQGRRLAACRHAGTPAATNSPSAHSPSAHVHRGQDSVWHGTLSWLHPGTLIHHYPHLTCILTCILHVAEHAA